jgi:hypothetical protein
MVLAYFSPDVALPVASVLAGVVGFIMMVGRAPYRAVARTFRSVWDRLKKGAGRRPG